MMQPARCRCGLGGEPTPCLACINEGEQARQAGLRAAPEHVGQTVRQCQCRRLPLPHSRSPPQRGRRAAAEGVAIPARRQTVQVLCETAVVLMLLPPPPPHLLLLLLLLLLQLPLPGSCLAVRGHSVSGFSSGATLAVNHGVAFSSAVRGIGVLGGSPYGCNILPNGGGGDYTTCSYWTPDAATGSAWLRQCDTYLQRRASAALIDYPGHLKATNVYLFSGTRDSMVWQRTMRAVEE